MQSTEGSKPVRFTLSIAPSEASSRASSPEPSPVSPTFHDYDDTTYDYIDAKVEENTLAHDPTPGLQGRDVYEAILPWWRASIRRKLVATVYEESKIIAQMQSKIRRPWLDAYFVYTSSLGTHTFFMILLPAFFFFGYHEMCRGLLIVLALGVYFSSVVKDLICSPRPFAPPVTRLTIGTHHLEYGFPSTHSTNSVSIALFFYAIAHRLASTPVVSPTNPSPSAPTSLNSSTVGTLSLTSASASDTVISPPLYVAICILLVIYTFSIVFGRLYTAMHSFTDCLMGVILGACIWWGHSDWSGFPFLVSSSNILYYPLNFLGLGTPTSPDALIIHLGSGLGGGKWVENWMQRGGWEVPLILIPLCLLAVHKHPQPVDDCPCFEDAIAFMSVVLGALVSCWVVNFSGVGAGLRDVVVMPGSGWVLEMGQWVQVERGWDDVLIWWSFAALKMVFGILTIFVWRLLAKSALHLILPPTFRLLARVFRLPHRRFYTPATEYKSVPSEFHSPGANGEFGLHPIPSVIDLPSVAGVGVETGGIGSGVASTNVSGWGRDLKMRNGMGNGGEEEENKVAAVANGSRIKDSENSGKLGVKHYDADVLTKVIVYAGIAVLSAEVIPIMFDVLGWGVKSWVDV